jgi:hypothetical protein
MYVLQRTADRVYHFYSPKQEDELYESLAGPGFAAAAVGFLVQAAVVASITGG